MGNLHVKTTNPEQRLRCPDGHVLEGEGTVPDTPWWRRRIATREVIDLAAAAKAEAAREEPPSEIEAELELLRSEIEVAAESQAALLKEYEAAKARIGELEGELGSAVAELKASKSRAADLETRLADANGQIEELTAPAPAPAPPAPAKSKGKKG